MHDLLRLLLAAAVDHRIIGIACKGTLREMTLHPWRAFTGSTQNPSVKLLWWGGQGLCLCLLSKRLEKGRFVWPQVGAPSGQLESA